METSYTIDEELSKKEASLRQFWFNFQEKYKEVKKEIKKEENDEIATRK